MSVQWIGRVIDGRYVVESMIGQGGMGVVLKARHKFTGAQVALKMLQPDLQVNQEAQERFGAEAQTPTTIGHPGIVQVLDAGKTPEGELYLAMELLTGRTLRQAMYPPMPPQIARRILLELLDALGAAHARGIIHRDLKPENVFLVGPQSTVKLLDFGIAKVVQAGRTAAGMMLGTLSYMAPEQLSDASSVDPRADLWAVGVMVYEMVSGKLPFRGTQLAEIMTALATQEPDPIRVYVPQATPAMEAFFTRALARSRDQRFASAQDMAISVSAMLIEGTAPLVVSTLNGLGPRSNVMTAADSGPQLPRRQLVAASAAQPVVSAPTPFAPQVPPPTAPPAVPPTYGTTPRHIGPMTPTAPGQPGWPQTQHVQTTPPKKQGLDQTSWIVIGGVVAAMVIGLAVVAARHKSITASFEDCQEVCSTLARCNASIDQGVCVLKCAADGKTETCIEESEGSCEAFASCLERVGGTLPSLRSLDSNPSRSPDLVEDPDRSLTP